MLYFLLCKVFFFFFFQEVNLVLTTFSVFKSVAYRATIAWNSLGKDKKPELILYLHVKLSLSLLV